MISERNNRLGQKGRKEEHMMILRWKIFCKTETEWRAW